MSMQFRLPRPAVAVRLKRSGPIVAVLMATDKDDSRQVPSPQAHLVHAGRDLP
jgi:hypothetical protein